MFDLPAALALGEKSVTGARVAVLGKTGGCDVDQQLAAPRPYVGQMQVPEGDRGRALVADQSFQRRVVGIGPDVLVVRPRIRVDDEQLIVVFADADCKRQLAEPGNPSFADLVTRPRDLRVLDRFERGVL